MRRNRARTGLSLENESPGLGFAGEDNAMVAMSITRRTPFDVPPRICGSLLDERILRNLLSPRGIVNRKPGFVLALSFIGLVTVIILLLHLLAQGARQFGFPSSQFFRNESPNAEYLDEHGVPKPIFVVAGGAPSTGSTFIFNILRILMRKRDPNTVASSDWMLAKLVPENSTRSNYDRVALLRNMGTSLLVKVHTAKQYYDFVGPSHKLKFADDVDLLVTGYRDLREETVSAFKMLTRNGTESESEEKWADLCQALIRRRNSLIIEAGTKVPVVDIRYEDWKNGGSRALLKLITQLAGGIPWTYTNRDFLSTMQEVQRLRVPSGGDVGQRVDWHVSNLMRPRHISVERLSDELLSKGLRAVNKEPKCIQWLTEKQYL